MPWAEGVKLSLFKARNNKDSPSLLFCRTLGALFCWLLVGQERVFPCLLDPYPGERKKENKKLNGIYSLFVNYSLDLL